MAQPKLAIELDIIDKVIELLGILGVLVLISLPIYFIDQLPDMVPSHFDANGDVNAYSEKSSIWTLPLVGVFLYGVLFSLNRFPHIFNYPQKITVNNARRIYTQTTKMIRTLNASMVWFFAYISWSTIQTAFGNQAGLGNWFAPVFILVTFGILGFFTYKSMVQPKD